MTYDQAKLREVLDMSEEAKSKFLWDVRGSDESPESNAVWDAFAAVKTALVAYHRAKTEPTALAKKEG
jgi:hypothetical protein